MSVYKLYIDESGKNTLTSIKSTEPHFCVGGVMVHANGQNTASDFLRKRGDEIKFKYWGHRSNIVFHGNEIRRNSGDFSIFATNGKKSEFEADLLQYVTSSGFRFVWSGVNKSDWITQNPPIAHALSKGSSMRHYEKMLHELLFEQLLEDFIHHLMRRKDHGQIIVEASDKQQDTNLLAVYNRLLFTGLPRNNWSSHDVRSHLTCISFVTKNNKDAETQMADLGTYFLNIDARVADSVGYTGVTAFDTSMAQIFKTKGYTYRDRAGGKVDSIRRLK